MKNTEKALSAASTIVYVLFLPFLGSVKLSKVCRICCVMSSKVRALGPKGALNFRGSGRFYPATLAG